MGRPDGAFPDGQQFFCQFWGSFLDFDDIQWFSPHEAGRIRCQPGRSQLGTALFVAGIVVVIFRQEVTGVDPFA